MSTDKTTPAEVGTSLEDDGSDLRQRLAWFESFDALMQSNVGNAGDILREVIQMRSAAAAERQEAFELAERFRGETLNAYRALFSQMLDDVTQLQGDAERLARRLADAIESLEAELQPDVAFPSLPNSLTPELVSSFEHAESGVSVTDGEPDVVTEPSVEPVELERAITVGEFNELSGADAPLPADGGQFILLVHGVPKAATALSLKSYLEGLDVVEFVEPREFAAGVLRLQLQVARNLGEQDLAEWSAANGLTTLHARPGLLEVKIN